MDHKVQQFLDRAAKNGVFPGAVLVYGSPAADDWQMLCTGKRGITRNCDPVTPNILYDLASLTKIISTTNLLMLTKEAGKVDINSVLPSLGWEVTNTLKKATVRDLLAHQSGLPPWRPYYLNNSLKNLSALKKAILEENPLCQPGETTIYSDLNFLLLGILLVELWERDLKELFKLKIKEPLGLVVTDFKPLGQNIAPTEDGFRVGGPLDWPNAPIKGPVPLGTVHDDNARFLGGVAGHAGLFGTASEVWKVLQHWAEALKGRSKLLQKASLEEFLEVKNPQKGPGRALGFDVGTGPIEGARGHLGYTGSSLWWKPQKDQAFVFLCNRVHPTARGSKMEAFRKELAALLWQ